MTVDHLQRLAESFRRGRVSAKCAVDREYEVEQISLRVRAPLDVMIISDARYELAKFYLRRLREGAGS